MSKNNKLVLIVDDEKSFITLYTQTLLELDVEVQTAFSAEEAFEFIQNCPPDIVVSDVKMGGMSGIELLKKVKSSLPELPFLLITAYANVKDAVNSLKLGAVDYLQKPIDLDELKTAVANALELSVIDSEFEVPMTSLADIVHESKIMKNLLNDAYRVASSDVTVFLRGESGVGKEVIADFIHKNSKRFNKKIVTLNCASIPASILSSELFGHEKGAFTGAIASRLGKFREADGGTLFLDEIGDMPIELQPSLLRAIEYGKISPLGADNDISVNVRLIAATNKNIEDCIKNGTFREDLYYRLNVITLEIPPLKERQDDIIPLARFFLKNGEPTHKRLSSNAIRILQNYSWPGNVRELSNSIKRAKILSRTEMIMPEHLPFSIKDTIKSTANNLGNNTVFTFEENEITAIKNALAKTNGNQTKAAELLGISRRTIINKIKKFGELLN